MSLLCYRTHELAIQCYGLHLDLLQNKQEIRSVYTIFIFET